MSLIAWIDLETGGLNNKMFHGARGSQVYPILEVACVVTGFYGDPIEETECYKKASVETKSLIDKEPFHEIVALGKDAVLSEWSEENLKNLILKCRGHQEWPISFHDENLRRYLDKYINLLESEDDFIFMGGNSIRLDREFMEYQMPETCNMLHYRQIDISTMKEVFRNAYGFIGDSFKECKHSALDDVMESIQEYKNYLDFINGDYYENKK